MISSEYRSSNHPYISVDFFPTGAQVPYTKKTKEKDKQVLTWQYFLFYDTNTMPSNKKTKRQLLRNIADGLSISRIFLSLLALAFVDRQPVFLILFALSGLTDLADGPLARLSHLPSERGALLDTLADLPLTVAVLVYFIRSYGTLLYAFLPWIITTVTIRIAAIVVTAYRFKTFAILHTWLNKLSGLLLFLLPFGLNYMPSFQSKLLVIVIATASVSALEELGIELTASDLNRNRRGVWDR